MRMVPAQCVLAFSQTFVVLLATTPHTSKPKATVSMLASIIVRWLWVHATTS